MLLLVAGCAATYVTPGGPVRLDDINRADIAAEAARKPSPNFPARIAVTRVQAANYRSYTAEPYVSGASFSVVTTQDLATDEQMEALTRWPDVAGIAPMNRMLLPAQLEAVDDLRVAAAKVQADILLVYTLDTTFRVQGRGYGPLAVISLGLIPDRDAYITSTASALFIDVRTGYVYGLGEATAKASGLTNAWSSGDTVDRKRLDAEQEAFARLLVVAAKTWSGIVARYGQ